MYEFLKNIHSFLPYLLLPILAVAAVVFLAKSGGKKPFTGGDKALALITLILAHLQLVFGLILYFISPIVDQALASGELMSNATYRFYGVEHLVTMLLAIILITVGYSRGKRKTENGAKFKTLGIFYLLGLILALLRIPWDAWLA